MKENEKSLVKSEEKDNKEQESGRQKMVIDVAFKSLEIREAKNREFHRQENKLLQ